MARRSKAVEGPIAAAAALVFALVVLAFSTTVTSAQTPTCEIEVNGQDVLSADSPSRPLSVPATGPFTVSVEAEQSIQNGSLSVRLASVPVHTIQFSPTQTANTWTDTFSLDSFEAIGAGLYEVVGTIPPCPTFTAWVVVMPIAGDSCQRRRFGRSGSGRGDGRCGSGGRRPGSRWARPVGDRGRRGRLGWSRTRPAARDSAG